MMKKLLKYIISLHFVNKLLKENDSMTKSKNGNKDIQNYQIDKKKDEEKVISGTLIDVGLSEYQVEWQRIGNMQQSSSILKALIAIVYSVIVIFLNKDYSENIDTIKYFNQIVLHSFVIDTIFLILSFIFFILLLIPANIRCLSTPLDIFNNFKLNTLYERFFEILNILDNSLINLNAHLYKKFLKYTLSLWFCSITLAVQIIFITDIIVFKLVNGFYILYYYIVIVLIILSLSILFIIKYFKLKSIFNGKK